MIKQISNSIINSGTEFQKSLFDKRKIRLLNILFIISIVSSEMYSIIYLIINPTLLSPLVYSAQFFVSICIFGILLNRWNKIQISQHLLCIALTGITCMTTFVQIGTVAETHFYFLLFALTPLLIWKLKQLIPILFYFTINTILYVYAEFFMGHSNASIIFPHNASLIIGIFTVMATLFSLLAALWVNLSQIEENENQLSELIATKDKFFSIIAHDMKSPFNSILGLSELMAKGNEVEDNKEISQRLFETSSQAYKLLENLLDWSRIQSGVMSFNPQKEDLKKLLEESIEIFNVMAINKQITINFKLDKSIYANVDKDMFNTITRNLLSNAIKFSYREGDVTILVAIQDKNIIVTFSDNGIGIDPRLIGDIFKLTDNTNQFGTEKEKGTGLGLLLCKEFIEKHNGKIWVESELGKGSNFIFSIPSINN